MDNTFEILKVGAHGQPPRLENRTVSRVVEALEFVAGAKTPLRLVDFARALSLPVSSTHALLKKLQNLGFIASQEGESGYRIGPRLVRLGFQVTESIHPVPIARPYLEDLMYATNEDIYLAVRIGNGIAYADQVFATHTARFTMELGTRRPLHSTAAGKLLLSYLSRRELDEVLAGLEMPPQTPHTITDPVELRKRVEEIRRVGYALNSEESIEGIVALAIPFFDALGRFGGAVVLSCPTHRFVPNQRRFMALTHECANQVSERLGWIPDSVSKGVNA